MHSQESVMQQIKSTHANFSIVIGTMIGITLFLYFFTYAQLADRSYSGWLLFEGISAMVMVFMLYRLKHIALFFTKLKLGRKKEFKEILASLTAHNLPDA